MTVLVKTCFCVEVTWRTPLYDGDAPLLYTQLQFIDTSNSSAIARNVVTESGAVEVVEVCDLTPNVVYSGSVWAVNRVGVSTSVEVELLISATGEKSLQFFLGSSKNLSRHILSLLHIYLNSYNVHKLY